MSTHTYTQREMWVCGNSSRDGCKCCDRLVGDDWWERGRGCDNGDVRLTVVMRVRVGVGGVVVDVRLEERGKGLKLGFNKILMVTSSNLGETLV